MGHYMEIRFEAKLNEFGTKVISMLYAAQAWDEVHKTFWEHSYLFADLARHDPVVPFGCQFKENKHSFDETAGIWSVNAGFKWKWPVEDAIGDLLPHIIQEPTVVHVSHDLWDNPRIRTAEPISTRVVHIMAADCLTTRCGQPIVMGPLGTYTVRSFEKKPEQASFATCSVCKEGLPHV